MPLDDISLQQSMARHIHLKAWDYSLQIEEAQAVLAALRAGEVDGLVVGGAEGDRVYRLEGAEQPFAALVNHMNTGALLLAPDGSLLFVNPYLARLLELPEDEPLPGRLEHWVSSEDRSILERLCEEACHTPCTGDLHLLSAGGRRVPARLALSCATHAGTQVLCGAVTDLTEVRKAETLLDERIRERTAELERVNQRLLEEMACRHRQEEALQRALADSAERARVLDALMEHVPAGITIADAPDVTIRMVSRHGRELIGKPREVLEGIPVDEHADRWDIYEPDGITRARNEDLPLTRATQRGETVRDEIRVMGHPDGRRIPIICNAGPIRDGEGRVTGGIIVWRDISERLRMERELLALNEDLDRRVQARTAQLEESYQALRQSERLAAIGQMMAVLSHESRNALQNCQAALHMIERAEDPLKRRRYLGLALRALQDLQQAHEEVRDFAAPIRLECAPVSVAAVWREAWADLASSREGRDARLLESLPPEADLTCIADAYRLKQAFRNLMENSLAACEDPVVIQISLACTDIEGVAAVRIEVRDNGPGSPFEEVDRVAEPFYTTKSKGSGLGLTVVKRTIEAHGGRIEIHSQPGHGFEVGLILPRSAH